MSAVDAGMAKRNILLLAVAQSLYSCCVIIVFATAGLVGLNIAPSPSLATLPVSTFMLGVMFSTIPLSMLMRRFGRTPIFAFGALVHVFGALIATYAIYTKNFQLFCMATAVQGVFQATAGFYRFAAAETATADTKAIAISWVLTGGVVAAIAGTLISSNMAEAIPNHLYAGSYLAAVVLAFVNFCATFFMKLPKPTEAELAGPQRSWGELLRNPKLIVAMALAMISYAMMNLMMTASPVAMIGCGFTQKDASWVLQWHVLAMYVPSFFTGQLIKKFGVGRITAIGMVLLMGSAVVAELGLSFGHFAVALIVLGLGWNFGFIGATTMLTDCYRPSERSKVQAANDFGISALMVVASFSSGKLLADFGWGAVAAGVFAPAAIGLALIAWAMMAKPQTAA